MVSQVQLCSLQHLHYFFNDIRSDSNVDEREAVQLVKSNAFHVKERRPHY